MLGQDFGVARRLGGTAGRTTRRFRRSGALIAAAVAAITLSGNAVAAVGDPGIVSYVDNSGNSILGIVGDLVNLPAAGIEINHDPIAGQSEALSLNLGKAYNTVTVTVGALLAQEGPGDSYREWGAWEAFDATGSPIGEGTFYGPQTEVTINVPGMQYLVFTARPYTLFAAGTASPPDQGPGPEGGPNCSTGQACDSSDYYLLTLSAQGLSLPDPDATGADAWEDVNPAGFESTTPYLDGNGRFVDGSLVVNTAECAGDSGQNNTVGCTLELSERFKTVITNSPDVIGAIKVNEPLTIVDTRAICGVAGGTTPLGGRLPLGLEAGGGPFVPAHLCGIPNDAGVLEIVLVDIDSANFTTEYSVLEHEIDNTEIAEDGFECRTGAEILNATDDDTLGERRSKLPVVAWLPKAEGEIPVKQGDGTVIDELQDITYGCGSSRGGSARYSYFAYNLRHTVDANYRAIVRNALVQLSATIDQTSACVDSGNGSFAGIASGVKTVLAAYDSNRLPLAKQHLQKLLATVESHKQLNERYRGCFYDLGNGAILKGSPGEFPSAEVTDVVPRNFRADLIVQTRHALYMFGRMLGVIDQNLPDDFKGLPPI